MKNVLLSFIVMPLFFFHSTGSAKERLSLDEYVQQHFYEGLPYEETRLYANEDVQILIDMLNNEYYMEYWGNIVVALEIIGTDEVVNEVIKFIERNPVKNQDDTLYRAKKAAIIGLGYLANGQKSARAEAYLIASTNPNVWNNRGMIIMRAKHDTSDTRNVDLSHGAVLGLALAGTEKTQKALLRLSQIPSENTQLNERLSDMLDYAIESNSAIKENGLVSYYREANRLRKQ